MQRKDFRLIGIKGFGLSIPGGDVWRSDLADRYGVRMIEGTTDNIHSELQDMVQNRANDYAYSYNLLMLGYFEAKGL